MAPVKLTAEECGKRVRMVRDALFGPPEDVDVDQLERELDPVRRDAKAFEAARKSTLQAFLELLTEDRTLALLAMGRIAHARPHRAMLWKCLEAANLILMNPEMFESHQGVLRDIAGTMDKPLAMVIRCLECMRMGFGDLT